MKRKVACTSTGCLDYAPERYKKYDIDIIRLYVTFNGIDYTEGLDLDPVKFYAELETLKDPKNNLPRTGMVTAEGVKNCFDKAVSDGYDEIIVVTLSAYLSGSNNLIKNIAKEYEGKLKVTVVDSMSCSFSEGILAVKAAEMIEKGVPTDDIVKELEWMIAHEEFIAVDGKLDYLIYNGRLKGGKALMGKMLGICPVVGFNRAGELVSLASVRTRKKALQRECEMLKEMIGDRDENDYLLWHVYTGPSLLEELKEVEKDYGIKCNHEPVIMAPVCGCSNGPWLAGYGLVFLRKKDESL